MFIWNKKKENCDNHDDDDDGTEHLNDGTRKIERRTEKYITVSLCLGGSLVYQDSMDTNIWKVLQTKGLQRNRLKKWEVKIIAIVGPSYRVFKEDRQEKLKITILRVSIKIWKMFKMFEYELLVHYKPTLNNCIETFKKSFAGLLEFFKQIFIEVF